MHSPSFRGKTDHPFPGITGVSRVLCAVSMVMLVGMSPASGADLHTVTFYFGGTDLVSNDYLADKSPFKSPALVPLLHRCDDATNQDFQHKRFIDGKHYTGAFKESNTHSKTKEAGAFLIVMECIPDQLAARITQELGIPTIGIGAGKDCDGQVLVYHDLVGLFERFTPKFVKQYVNLGPQIREALIQYREDVEGGTFPGPEHSFVMKAEEAEKL